MATLGAHHAERDGYAAARNGYGGLLSKDFAIQSARLSIIPVLQSRSILRLTGDNP